MNLGSENADSVCTDTFLAPAWSSGRLFAPEITTTRVLISAWAYLKIVSSFISPHYHSVTSPPDTFCRHYKEALIHIP